MTKISSYSTDVNITGNDKWIGSDAQNFLITKNFTPNNLAGFFNDNNVIDIGLSIRYRYQTLDPGEEREQGTISFETEIGPQVNFSSITTFLLAKNTLKQNNVTQYLGFLVGAKVVISRSNNVNTFGYYTISSIEPYIPDPNFFVVTLNFISGNGFIYEDLDYLISLVDKSSGSGGSATWGDITGDITDQTDLINYLSEEYYPLNSNPAGYLTSASLSGYVPYTGATGTLDMGQNTITSQGPLGDYYTLDWSQLFFFDSLGGSLYLSTAEVNISGASGFSRLDANGLALNNATISYSALFSGDTFLLPNKLGVGGTFAMLSDIPSYTIPTVQQVLTAGDTATNKWMTFDNTSNDTIVFIDGSNSSIGIIGSDSNGSEITKNYIAVTNTLSGESIFIEKNRILRQKGGLGSELVFTDPTANRTITFKDESGTVAYLSDISTSSGIPHGTASGTDTYTATITGVTAYADGDAYLIRFTNGNTTGATLNINGVGAVALYRNNDGPLLGGDILDGGEMICVYNSTTTAFQCIGTSPNSLYAYVENDDSVTLTKGMPVYAFSGTGDRMTVKRANNTGDATSAQTVGLVMSSSIAAGQKGLVMVQGLLDGLSILPTSTWADGDPVYLGATDGTITNVKPYAPNHLVYLGVVTTASNGSAGRMYVRVQNGYELQELHNVQITSTPVNNDVLTYEASSNLYKMKSLGTILGYTPYKYLATNSTPHTGTLSEAVISTATILGGTYNSSDVMKPFMQTSKLLSVGNVTYRFRINTANTLTGATQVAIFTTTTTLSYAQMQRTFTLRDGLLYGYAFTGSTLNDFSNTGGALTSTSYNTANTLYFFFTVQLANVADSSTISLMAITN